MAIENNSEDIARSLEALRGSTAANKELAEAMKQARKQIGEGFTSLRKSLSDTDQDITKLNDGLDKMQKGVQGYTQSLDPATRALSKFADYTLGISKGANDITSRLTNMNRALSGTGANLGNTTGELLRLAHNAGFVGKDVVKFGQHLKNLGGDVRVLGTTAGEGAKVFGQMLNVGDEQRESLMRLGYTQDEVAEKFASYVKVQGLYGTTQGKTTNELRAGALDYLKTLQRLAALTGEDADAVQARIEANARELAWSEYLASLPDDQRKNMEKLGAVYEGALGEAVREYISTGSLLNDRTGLAGGAMLEFIESAKGAVESGKDFSVGAKELAKGYQYVREGQDTALRYNAEYAQQLGHTVENNKKTNNILAGDYKDIVDSQNKKGKANDNLLDTEAKLVTVMRKLGVVFDQFYYSMANVLYKFIIPVLDKITSAFTSIYDKISSIASKFGIQIAPLPSPDVGERVALGGSLADRIIKVESGGRTNAQSATSSAFGLGQFTKGTFESVAKQAKQGDLLYGKTWEDYKTSPTIQREALDKLISLNQSDLGRRGVEVNDTNTYLAHFLGSAGAANLLKNHSDSDNIQSVVGADQYAANKSLFDKVKTVGGLKAWAANKIGDAGPSDSYANGSAPSPDAGSPPVANSGSSGQSGADTTTYVSDSYQQNSDKLIEMVSSKLDQVVASIEKLVGIESDKQLNHR